MISHISSSSYIEISNFVEGSSSLASGGHLAGSPSSGSSGFPPPLHPSDPISYKRDDSPLSHSLAQTDLQSTIQTTPQYSLPYFYGLASEAKIWSTAVKHLRRNLTWTDYWDLRLRFAPSVQCLCKWDFLMELGVESDRWKIWTFLRKTISYSEIE